MAMVIMAAISIPTANMIGAQIQGMAESTDLTAAGNAARLAMEKLNNTPYASIPNSTVPGTPDPVNSLVVGSYTVAWDVQEFPVGAAVVKKKEITMTVKRTGTSPVLATLYYTFCKDVTSGL